MATRARILDMAELKSWSFYRAVIAEFVATLLFLYVTVAAIICQKKYAGADDHGVLLTAWAFGGMTFVIIHSICDSSRGGFGNPAIVFAFFLAKKMSLNRAIFLSVAQCLGATCGVGLVKVTMAHNYNSLGGGGNFVAVGYTDGGALVAEIMGTFVVVLTVISTTEKDLAPFAAAFAVFTVQLATGPITGFSVNPAKSFGAAVICNHRKVWDDQWLFWFGPYLGALLATVYHKEVVLSRAAKAIQRFYRRETSRIDSLRGHASRRHTDRSNPVNRPPRRHGTTIPSLTSIPSASHQHPRGHTPSPRSSPGSSPTRLSSRNHPRHSNRSHSNRSHSNRSHSIYFSN